MIDNIYDVTIVNRISKTDRKTRIIAFFIKAAKEEDFENALEKTNKDKESFIEYLKNYHYCYSNEEFVFENTDDLAIVQYLVYIDNYEAKLCIALFEKFLCNENEGKIWTKL